MGWKYSGDPSASVLDAVRFEVQDTDEKAQLLQDTEIEYAIKQEAPAEPPSEGEVLSAAARCCEVLVRRFSMQADSEFGSLKIDYSKMAEGFSKRAKELRDRAVGSHAPWIGGQSIAGKAARAEEPDRVQPAFVRDQFTTPYTGPLPIPVPGEWAQEG